VMGDELAVTHLKVAGCLKLHKLGANVVKLFLLVTDSRGSREPGGGGRLVRMFAPCKLFQAI
jgi:hypothetical protein